MAVSGISNYGNGYDNMYAAQRKKTTEKGISGEDRAGRTKGTQEGTDSRTESYLKKLQEKVPYVELETGMGLSMKRDKRSVIAVNPKLLEKMQNDPEAEKQYTETLKNIETAEKTVDAYYNALGGVVERTSHWYVDENGKYCHFAYTRRDDKLNKKLREEAKRNAEELIEKTREKARKKKEELQEQLAEKAEEAKQDDKKQDSSVDMQNPNADAAEAVEKLLTEKLENSESGEIYLNETDMEPVMEAIRKAEHTAPESSQMTGEGAAGRLVDLKL